MISVGTSSVRWNDLDRLRQRSRVVGVADALHVPAIGQEARRDVVAEGEIGVALDGDAVAVVDPAEIAEHLRWPASEAASLETPSIMSPSPQNAIDVVVEQREIRPVEMLGQPARRHRHADAVAAALAERPGRRLDAGGQVIFRMAGAFAAELREIA